MNNPIFYAEVFESHRYNGTRTISVHEFESEKDMEKFISKYNEEHLDHSGFVPEIYTMAERAGWRAIHDYQKSQLQDETFSK